MDEAAETPEDGEDLKEVPIPEDEEADDGTPKRKVVTTDDAPEFDPSDL